MAMKSSGPAGTSRVFDVVIERDEDGFFVASVPQLPGCHTQAKSLDELDQRVREAIKLYLEVEGFPSGGDTTFIGVHRVEVGGVGGVAA